jgi:hypothetical protein
MRGHASPARARKVATACARRGSSGKCSLNQARSSSDVSSLTGSDPSHACVCVCVFVCVCVCVCVCVFVCACVESTSMRARSAWNDRECMCTSEATA